MSDEVVRDVFSFFFL